MVVNDLSNIPSGTVLRHTLRGHEGIIRWIAWSPNGQIIASSSEDQTIRLWDAQSGQLCRTIVGHEGSVFSVAWSPDGRTLASGSYDNTIRLWNPDDGQLLQTLIGHTDWVYSVAWSPDGRMLASGSGDHTIRLWDIQTGQLLQTLIGHTDWVYSVAWSPDGRMLASSSDDHTICLWNMQTGHLLQTLTGHSGAVRAAIWSPDGQTLASGSDDHTIRLWNPESGWQTNILEGQAGAVTCVSFSADGRLLASKSLDGTIRLWRTDMYHTVAVLDEPASIYLPPSLAFHPSASVLATLGEKDMVLRIWDLDVNTLLSNVQATPPIHYTNAKVVLVGDSGVGKSGLGLVLAGQLFAPTMSTHGRHIWTFDNQEIELDTGPKETRETLLWDLAGQPGYRLIHQLHLNEVAVALVVFDTRSETDPFAGVYYWSRSLQLAERVEGNPIVPIKKFLVAARIDRGGTSVSHSRIESLVHKMGFDGFFETSAKEGQNITELAEAIKQVIDWETLPKVISTELFQNISAFLIAEKGVGRLLSTVDNLYYEFLKNRALVKESTELYAQFETCVGRLESRGLIRQLGFGSLLLLQPELLDIYASALVNAVRNEPDGLGSIVEEKVRAADFRIPEDERLKDKQQEKLLLIAMIEDLLRHEIALREQGDDRSYLVFPSQSTRENPDLPDPEGKSVIFDFEGPISNIYATLAVRLSHSGLFIKKDLWKNAVTYTAQVGGTCGMFLRFIEEGRGELVLFFDKAASEETKLNFENYVQLHLQRRALPESLTRKRVFICSECGFIVTNQLIRLRKERGFHWLRCPACESKVSLLDREERLNANPSELLLHMDRTANMQRERGMAASILQGKIATNDFDVFLCYNDVDKSKVKQIGAQLKEHGILPWLDEWELLPGQQWQRLLEHQIEHIKSVAVFVGEKGIGPWQNLEIRSFLREFARREVPIIPVILPDTPEIPELPLFLEGMSWVDFGKQNPDPVTHLIWGITGERWPMK